MAQDPEPTKNPTNEPNSTHVSIEGAIHKTTQAPSDCDAEVSNTVGRICHPPPLSQVDDRVNDELDDSNEMSEGTTEDGGASGYWETVSDFATGISKAARAALLNRRMSFKRVVAVITYWETATGLSHLRVQADKLGKVFEESLQFEVMVYKIPNSVNELEFCSTIGAELKKIREDQDSLFILYYGGHASMKNLTNERLFKKENRPGPPHIEWSSSIRTLFKTGVVCSKLFIFDCCHAGGMIDSTLPWETSCELLGACGPDVEASALKTSSFTTAFLEEISNNTYDIGELHWAFTSTENMTKYNLQKFPHYENFMRDRSSLASALIKKVGSPSEPEDGPQGASKKLDRLGEISDAVMCIVVKFKSTGKTLLEDLEEINRDWRRWFKFTPTGCDDVLIKACQGAKLLGVFNSNSCITMWSFPLWLWNAMAPLSGYQHIGIIRPQNLALAASGTQSRLAYPDYSSNMIMGEVSLSPRSPDNDPPILDMILEGRLLDGGPHLESTKPQPTRSPEVEATSKPPRKNLPGNPAQPDTDHLGRWLTRHILPKKKLEDHAPLLSSSPLWNPSGSSTLDGPAIVSLGQTSLVNIIQNPSERRIAQKIQTSKTTEGKCNSFFGWPQNVNLPEHAREKYTSLSLWNGSSLS